MTTIGTAIDNKQQHLYLEVQPVSISNTPYKISFPIKHDRLSINDSERTSGVYILGKPRMGKSWLIINMILQDMEEGKGVFFIDPHGEAIDQLITHTCKRFMIYDFEDEKQLLGINPLAGDRSNPTARNESFAKTKAIFDKLWKNTFEEKPWLQLIIQNTIYAFIENNTFTLVDFPLFFRDRDFRNFLVSNMQYNMQVEDYWLKTFASKDRRDQDNIMEAAQTRCEIMFAHPAVRHFFGHTTYIDIGMCVEGTSARLVKFSTRLPSEVKKIIGTALINELVFAIQKRQPGSPLFCLYIDEFQNFVSFDDIATLITQAPKYGISTTLAHHERFGQLEDDKRIMGATSTIANKIIFQITGKDAHDFAPEFKKDPPTELRREEQYVVSQNPLYDLLRGHTNPQIREFVNSHMRPLKERLEDIGGDTQLESYIRMDFLDEANLFRIDERVQSAGKDLSAIHGALDSAGRSIQSARGQTDALKQLALERQQLRATIREMNRFFTDIMEGGIRPGQDKFSAFLMNRIFEMTGFDDNQKAILVLFITLTYGNTNIPLAIPYWFAQKHNIFTETVRAIRREAENKSRQEEREAVEKIRFGWEERLKEIKRDRRDVGSEITDMAAFEKSWQEDNEKRLRKIREYQRENADRAILELIPLNLPSKIMTPGERQAILRACRAEFDTNCNTAIRVVENFVNFCILLSDPSDHIMVKSGQYVERPIPSRTIGDMVNEMEGELTELPKYTAYAKILQGKEMRKGKITTHQLPTKTYTWSPDQMRFFTNDLCRTRKEIEEAIRTRQESWRPKIEEVEEIEPEAPKMGEKRTAKKKTNIDAKPSSKPPPTSYD